MGQGIFAAAGRFRRFKGQPVAKALEPRCLLAATSLTATGTSLHEKFDQYFSADVANFTATGTKLSAKSFAATIVWSDGVTSKGTIVLENDTQYVFAGAAPPLPPDWEGQIAYFYGAPGTTLSNYNFTIAWGDGTSTSSPDFFDELSDSGTLYNDHDYAVGGSSDSPIQYTITVSVTGPGIDPANPLIVQDTILVYQNGTYT